MVQTVAVVATVPRGDSLGISKDNRPPFRPSLSHFNCRRLLAHAVLPVHLRLWTLSAALVIVGVVYLFLLEQPLTALVFVVAGILVSLAPGHMRTRSPSGREEHAAVAPAGLEGLAALVKGLGVEGRGIHVPTDASVRLFLPADDSVGTEDIPRIDADTALIRGRPGALGLALLPPGSSLLDEWSRRGRSPKEGGTEAAAATIRRALPELGVGDDVRVEAGDGRLRVQYRHTRYLDLCRTTREEWAPWHLQGGCPVCSLVACLAAISTGTPLRFAKVEAAGDVISLVLESLPRRRQENAVGRAVEVPARSTA